MAERRMFAKTIVLSDAFLDMPMSARCLYFTLSMFADDDGFVGSPKATMRQCGASQDDIAVLLQKRFILGFESGVIVIKHWRMNNYLQNDRHQKTTYIEELNTLCLDEKKAYVERENTQCIQNVYKMYTQYSIDKDSIDKDSIGEYIPKEESAHSPKSKYGKFENVLLSDDEVAELKTKFGENLWLEKVEKLSSKIAMRGYKYKSHFAVILQWDEEDNKQNGEREDNYGEMIYTDLNNLEV